MSTLSQLLGVNENDPVYIAAKEAAIARYKRAEIRHCANGCTNYYDPETEEVFAGFGAAGCKECD